MAKKTVTIELTPEQQQLLKTESKGNFTKAVFTFTADDIEPPEHTVSCNLVRVANVNKIK
jgi:hypothetical protein